ncbi:MAG: transporter substrate-binding domain-containing protein, partial [Desulfotignum sp.]|nr:transporter substrate-binding domain-containing protein [Desulfotignum sp.]
MIILPFTPVSDVKAAAEPAVRSAAEIDYPPFSVVDEHGYATGFSVELLRAALAAMDRDVTFKTGPWAQVRG